MPDVDTKTEAPAAGPAGERARVARALFRFLDEETRGYCVVGITDGFPDHIESDIDIVVDQDDWTTFPEKLDRFCEAQGVKLVQVLQHEQTAYYFVLSWFDPDGQLHFLMPDVCSDYYRQGRKLLSAEAILEGRRPALDAAGANRGFTIASPAVEFIYYLMKRVDKSELEPIHCDHLQRTAAQDFEAALAQIGHFWSGADAALLGQAVRDGDWMKVRAAQERLRRALRRGLPVSIGSQFGELMRKIRRVMVPTGCWIAMLGPDGCGKSSVGDEIERALAPAFRRTQKLHLRPRLDQSSKRSAPTTDPHGTPPRGWAPSLVKLGIYLADYCIGYWTVVRPRLVRSTFVIFDRYCHDMLVDQRRYRYGGPIWALRLVAALVPRPDLFILLDAAPEVLLARKSEITEAEARRLQGAYAALVQDLPNGRTVDAAQPLARVAADIEAIVLDHLAARTRRRLGLAGS